MCQIEPERRLQIVQHYLSNNTTLMQTANKFNVHYRSVYKWVKLYKKEGKQRLLSTYRRVWNRYPEELETKIALLKEKNPALTVREARKVLKTQGLRVSIKGIWNVWKRYGYTGFIKKKYSDNFMAYVSQSKEDSAKLKIIKEYLQRKKIREAAKLLNSLYVFKNPEFFENVPDELLSLKRRLEKLTLLFGKIPFPEYRKKSKRLRQLFEKKKMYYSSIRAGIEELIALEWMNKTEEHIKLIHHLRPLVNGIKDPGIEFTFLLSEGIAWANLLKSKKAQRCTRKCKKMLRYYNTKDFLTQLICEYSFLEDFKSLRELIEPYLGKEKTRNIKIPITQIASFLFTFGEYRSAIRLLKEAETRREELKALGAIVRAQCFLAQGKIHSASKYAQFAFQRAKKAELFNYLHSASLIQAAVYYALGVEKKGRSLIKKYIPLLKKLKMHRKVIVRKIILGVSRSHREIRGFPVIKLLTTMQRLNQSKKTKGYSSLLKYASKNKITGYLNFFILFFPEVILNLLRRGKPTGLPKAILRLPLFNKEAPVYEIKFLGSLTVYKNQKYLKTKLRPKDTAFLIQFALKAGEPGKSISLDKIYYNFWRNSVNPPRNLSHTLVRIKKELKIPPHLLEVSYRKDNPVLINRGIHFITDYGKYEQSLAQAKALLRAGEWGFAKREFLRAFKLFRGEPFKKMYDDWSDDKRLEVLFSYEKEVKTFADELRKRGKTEEAERVLERAERIVGSE